MWLMPWLMRVRDRAGLEAAARGDARLTVGDGECWKWDGNTGKRVTKLRRAQRWWVWEGPQVQRSSSDAGWLIPSVTVVPLLFSAVLLGLRCTFPSFYR